MLLHSWYLLIFLFSFSVYGKLNFVVRKMGGKTTKLFRNSTQPGSKAQDDTDFQYNEQFNHHDHQQSNEPFIKNPISPFVHYRRG